MIDNLSIEDTTQYRYVNSCYIISVIHLSVKHIVTLCASYKLYVSLQSAQLSQIITPIGHDIVEESIYAGLFFVQN